MGETNDFIGKRDKIFGEHGKYIWKYGVGEAGKDISRASLYPGLE